MLVLNVDYVIVGHVLGAEKLGLYVLAFNISGWPINIFGAVIRSVSLPAFSRLRLDGPGDGVRVRAAPCGSSASITIPVCFIIGALAHPAVVAIYGERWEPAAAALVGLSVLGAARILIELCGDFLVTLGRHAAALCSRRSPGYRPVGDAARPSPALRDRRSRRRAGLRGHRDHDAHLCVHR